MSKARPKGISPTAAMMACLITLSYGLMQPNTRTTHAPFLAGWGVMYLLVVWFYWKGKNWARWLVMAYWIWILSISIRDVNKMAAYRWSILLLSISEGLFGAFLLYWLNTQKVRAFFTSSD